MSDCRCAGDGARRMAACIKKEGIPQGMPSVCVVSFRPFDGVYDLAVAVDHVEVYLVFVHRDQ